QAGSGGWIHAEELSRRHTDHRERHVVDQDLLADGIHGAAEPALAVTVTDDGDGRRAGAIITGSNQASCGCRYREAVEEIAGDVLAVSELRVAIDQHVHLPGREEVSEDAGQHRSR